MMLSVELDTALTNDKIKKKWDGNVAGGWCHVTIKQVVIYSIYAFR